MSLPHNITNLLKSILGPAGFSDQILRKDVAERATHVSSTGNSSEAITDIAALSDFIDKVKHSPYKVTDNDIVKLKAEGLSEDEIFELSVTTAVGTGVGRLELTLALIEEAK